MLLFLYGNDTFRSLKKLKDIVDSYREKNRSGFNLREFNLGEEDFKIFRDELRSKSIFRETKLLIVRHAFSNEKTEKEVLSLKKALSCSPDIIVFFERGEVPKNNSLLRVALVARSCLLAC